jgi:S-formylglutathione hydrolase
MDVPSTGGVLMRILNGVACVLLLAAPAVSVLGQSSNTVSEPVWSTFSLPSKTVLSPVEVGVLLPPGYSPSEPPVPLLLFLHGGGGSAQDLFQRRDVFAQLWRAGTLPRVVVATPSTGQTFLMNFRDGSQRWESFVLEELIPTLRDRFRVTRDSGTTLLAGWSMGGMGALRIAFKHPDLFGAVAAWAPAVEPALAFADIDPSDRFRSQELYERIYGSPVDQDYWKNNHPPYLLRARMKEIATSNIQIYLAVGQNDQLLLFRGAEVMHRMLFDAGQKHEFRLARDADHLTISTGDNFADGLKFLGRALNVATR